MGKSEQCKGKIPYITKTRCKILLCQYSSIYTFHQRNRLKDAIDLLLEQNIMMEVTDAPIVVISKKNCDRTRMCVDLSHLNKHVVHEHYQSSTPAQAVAGVAASEAKIFTVLNTLKGYHQCPLDQESQPLTTFITPLGDSNTSEHRTTSPPYRTLQPRHDRSIYRVIKISVHS